MKKPVFILLIFALMAFAAADASAYRGKPGPPRGMDHPHHGPFFGDVERMQELLDLTDVQVQQIRKINEDFREKSGSQEAKMRPHLEKLRELLLQENINITKIRVKLRQISNIEIELKILQISHRMALQKVLTPAQREILKKEWRYKKRHHMRGKGRQDGRRMRRFDD